MAQLCQTRGMSKHITVPALPLPLPLFTFLPPKGVSSAAFLQGLPACRCQHTDALNLGIK